MQVSLNFDANKMDYVEYLNRVICSILGVQDIILDSLEDFLKLYEDKMGQDNLSLILAKHCKKQGQNGKVLKILQLIGCKEDEAFLIEVNENETFENILNSLLSNSDFKTLQKQELFKFESDEKPIEMYFIARFLIRANDVYLDKLF